MATFTPVPATPPARTAGGGGGRPAEDIAAIFAVIEKKRDTSFKVAEKVHNPNRYFDALKALGAKVETRRVGEGEVDGKLRGLYDVYATVPAGDLKPHLKPSQRR